MKRRCGADTHIIIHIHIKENLNMIKNTPDIKLFTLAEVAEALNITTRSLMTYIKQGRLKAVKLAGKWRISEDNLRAFVNGEGANEGEQNA